MSHGTLRSIIDLPFGFFLINNIISDGTLINESCVTLMNDHVADTSESCHTHEWVMSHIRRSRTNASCHTLKHIWMHHGTHMNESHAHSLLTFTMTHAYTTWIIHSFVPDVTHLRVYVAWSFHRNQMSNSYVWHDVTSSMNESCHNTMQHTHVNHVTSVNATCVPGVKGAKGWSSLVIESTWKQLVCAGTCCACFPFKNARCGKRSSSSAYSSSSLAEGWMHIMLVHTRLWYENINDCYVREYVHQCVYRRLNVDIYLSMHALMYIWIHMCVI